MNTNTINTTDTKQIPLDELPMSPFHWKVFVCSLGCPLIDGYAIGIIAIALSLMGKQIQLTPTMSGLIGTASLAGMFLGSTFGGYLCDRLGRRKMFTYDFAFITIISAACFFVSNPIMLVILRFLLGIGLGADYPIAGPYLAEFAPKSKRGSLVGTLNAFWYVGYAASFIIGFFMVGIGDTNWRWMLASTGILTFIFLILRSMMPESPRWLMSQGRVDEANKILKIFGDNVTLSSEDETEGHTSLANLFKGGYAKWVFFVAAFWSLQNIPIFGIGTFFPTVMEKMGFVGGNMQYLGPAIMNTLFLLGLIPVYFLVETWGRRPTIMWPFFVSGAALFILGYTANMNMPILFVIIIFFIYGAFNNAMGAHCWIYPNELFPTHIRGTAMGIATGATRIASNFSQHI
jgi:Arabinose efflux permease